MAGRASGSLANAFGMMYEPFGGTGIQRLYHAYFDFSNDSDFTGAAKGYGLAAKLGAVYRPLPTLSFGATYHTKTSLSDLEASEAELSMGINVDPGIFQGAPTGNYMDMIVPVSGEITVSDFEWPAMYGVGVAYRPVPRVMLAMDVHRIGWSDVMDDFRMTFQADDTPENGGFAGLELDAVLFQGWEDQTVIAVGGAVGVSDELTLRAGFNGAKNPVPSKYLNALFPAIVENHLTFGAGYLFGTGSLDVSMAFGLETSDTNPGNGSTVPPVESTHSQFNWMLMYGHRF
jgi:long-chain fatty acid transport protein